MTQKADSSIVPVFTPVKSRKGAKTRGFGFGRKVVKGMLTGLGVVLMIVAVPISWLPGPLGLPILVVGLVLVLKNAAWTKRLFVRMKRRYPNWIMPVRKLLRRNPPFVSVLWQMILRMERMVLNFFKARVQLAFWRRQFIRRPFFRRNKVA